MSKLKKTKSQSENSHKQCFSFWIRRIVNKFHQSPCLTKKGSKILYINPITLLTSKVMFFSYQSVLQKKNMEMLCSVTNTDHSFLVVDSLKLYLNTFLRKSVNGLCLQSRHNDPRFLHFFLVLVIILWCLKLCAVYNDFFKAQKPIVVYESVLFTMRIAEIFTIIAVLTFGGCT